MLYAGGVMTQINPLNPKKKHLPILKAFLKQNAHKADGWRATNDYYVEFKKTTINVSFTHTIIKRKSKKNYKQDDPAANRYEVIDSNLLGKGSYGRVYPVAVTLKIAHKKLIFKKKPYGKRRIVKIISDADNNFTKALNEYTLSKMTPHSHPKHPIVFRKKVYSVSRRMEGTELFKIINDDLLRKPELTLKQRFDLSMRLIEAVQTQIFDVGLVHRDLKPENIMVDISNGHIGTIDFGLAKLATGYLGSDNVGTPGYLSPEVLLNKNSSQMSDIYGLGRILALIWRIDPVSYSEKFSQEEMLSWMRQQNYSSLFDGIKNQMHPQTADDIQSLLEKMTAFEPAHRIDLKTAFTELKRIHDRHFYVQPKPKKRWGEFFKWTKEASVIPSGKEKENKP